MAHLRRLLAQLLAVTSVLAAALPPLAGNDLPQCLAASSGSGSIRSDQMGGRAARSAIAGTCAITDVAGSPLNPNSAYESSAFATAQLTVFEVARMPDVATLVAEGRGWPASKQRNAWVLPAGDVTVAPAATAT